MIGKGERLCALVFGLFLVGVGAYALLFGPVSAVWRLVGGAVLMLWGRNLIQASWRGRPSWLARLGPLP